MAGELAGAGAVQKAGCPGVAGGAILRNCGTTKEDAMAEQPAIREVVAVFDSREALENAIEDLQSNGFDRTQLSLLARRDAVEEQLRQPLTDVREVADDPATPRSEPLERPDVGNVMGVAVGTPAAFAALATAGVIALAGGPLAGIAIGALAAGGGVGALGGLLAKSFNDQVVADFEQQIERGGILLWVSLRSPEQEAEARRILARHVKGEVRVHEVATDTAPRRSTAPLE